MYVSAYLFLLVAVYRLPGPKAPILSMPRKLMGPQRDAELQAQVTSWKTTWLALPQRRNALRSSYDNVHHAILTLRSQLETFTDHRGRISRSGWFLTAIEKVDCRATTPDFFIGSTYFARTLE